MQTPSPPASEAASATALIESLATRLPPPDQRCVMHSELGSPDPADLQRLLSQDQPVIANYTHFWLQGLERHGDFFVTWMYGALAGLLGLMIIGGMLGLVGGGSAGEAIGLFGLSGLVGLGVALRYAQALPPMKEHNLLLLDGASRTWIYACAVRNDQPTETLVQVPFDRLAVTIHWGQIADHSPSFLSVILGAQSRPGEAAHKGPGLTLATVDHSYPAPLPAALEQKAKSLALVLGAQYLGLQPWED
ncbi:hypothetical protein AACH06_17260 [Ideonella sp. DXS29W]|uniref:Uncharacterized protein n=1 Tax=Ideonella lacteola TaxID=2984193 RepID=A0ABU9BRI3_9BURK